MYSPQDENPLQSTSALEPACVVSHVPRPRETTDGTTVRVVPAQLCDDRVCVALAASRRLAKRGGVADDGARAIMATLAGKDALLHWCQERTAPYRRCGISVENFATSFQDGRAFVALVHSQSCRCCAGPGSRGTSHKTTKQNLFSWQRLRSAMRDPGARGTSSRMCIARSSSSISSPCRWRSACGVARFCTDEVKSIDSSPDYGGCANGYEGTAFASCPVGAGGFSYSGCAATVCAADHSWIRLQQCNGGQPRPAK
jgi:hypothetical protein